MGADMLRGKRTCYEGGLQIPLLIRWPGKIAPQVRSELVSTIDLVPTILMAADAPSAEKLPGLALQPLFKPGPVEWRKYCFAEYHTHAAAPNYFPQRSICTERYKLIETLLPDEVHPDYDLTLSKLEKEAQRREISGGLDLHCAIAQASPEARSAYTACVNRLVSEPYDLQVDPLRVYGLGGFKGTRQRFARTTDRPAAMASRDTRSITGFSELNGLPTKSARSTRKTPVEPIIGDIPTISSVASFPKFLPPRKKKQQIDDDDD